MKHRNPRIAILGTGEIGTAIAGLLSPEHQVVAWEGLPADGSAPEPLEPIVADSEFVFFCVPVRAHPDLAPRVASALPPGGVCVSVAKGLDEAGRTAAQILKETLPDDRDFAVAYGPMIAEDLQAGRLGFADVACERKETFRRVRSVFKSSSLKLAHTADVDGASWAVVLKNVYVPLIGAADELDLGDNVRGLLTSEVFRELARMVEDLSGDTRTPYGLAGLGDFVGSATSSGSHHRELGRMLARGESAELDGEGISTLAVVTRLRLIDERSYPLYRLMRQMVAEPAGAADGLRAFLNEWGD